MALSRECSDLTNGREFPTVTPMSNPSPPNSRESQPAAGADSHAGDQETDLSNGAKRSGQRTFYIVWFGQVVSLVGSGLTWFGLSIWVFLETGSVTSLSMVLLASNLPRIALSQVAGALVDRWDRRWAMILSDAGSGVGTLVIFVLFLNDAASIPALVAVAAFSSAFQAFQWPAYQAAITLLVPKRNYQRASGLVQMAEAISQLIGPLFAAVVIVNWGVIGLVLIDITTFTFAIGTLLAERFPRPPPNRRWERSEGHTLVRDAVRVPIHPCSPRSLCVAGVLHGDKSRLRIHQPTDGRLHAEHWVRNDPWRRLHARWHRHARRLGDRLDLVWDR